MNTTHFSSAPAPIREHWSAVVAMSLCVALLIAAEFMPVSLPIATLCHRLDRRHVLMGLATVMLASLIVIAVSPNFAVRIPDNLALQAAAPLLCAGITT